MENNDRQTISQAIDNAIYEARSKNREMEFLFIGHASYRDLLLYFQMDIRPGATGELCISDTFRGLKIVRVEKENFIHVS